MLEHNYALLFSDKPALNCKTDLFLAEINGILVFAHPPTVRISYIGLYVVEEKCRGQGIGRKMWTIMEQHTEPSRIRCLNSRKHFVIKKF